MLQPACSQLTEWLTVRTCSLLSLAHTDREGYSEAISLGTSVNVIPKMTYDMHFFYLSKMWTFLTLNWKIKNKITMQTRHLPSSPKERWYFCHCIEFIKCQGEKKITKYSVQLIKAKGVDLWKSDLCAIINYSLPFCSLSLDKT